MNETEATAGVCSQHFLRFQKLVGLHLPLEKHLDARLLPQLPFPVHSEKSQDDEQANEQKRQTHAHRGGHLW
jgi:hypothetical protein